MSSFAHSNDMMYEDDYEDDYEEDDYTHEDGLVQLEGKEQQYDSEAQSDDESSNVADEYVDDADEDDISDISSKAEQLHWQMRQAFDVVQHLMSPQHQQHNWPFMVAVDSKNGALWDYDTIIKDPVWLKKIRDEILSGVIDNVTEVFRCLRLMFRNCYRYNGPQHSVTRRALRLEHIMEQRIELMHPDVRVKCTLEASEGEEAVVDSKVISRRRNARSKQPGFFSHVLYWARHDRADREKEFRRQQLETRRQQRHEKERRVVDWERRLLRTEAGQRMRSMWQIPQLVQFIHLSLRALHIFEVPMYEMERMLLLPQSSETLAMLMSSLVSSPLARIKLPDLPPMPYLVWTSKLTARVQQWYRVYAREHSRPDKLFDALGIESTFWHVMGPRNPLNKQAFHELSFYQRVCLVKAMCDFLFHIHKTIQECVMETAEQEPREHVLGSDVQGYEYIHFPHLYVQDVRVYRRRGVIDDVTCDRRVTCETTARGGGAGRGARRRPATWSRAQLSLMRRVVARARQWRACGGTMALRHVCLGAAFSGASVAAGGENDASDEEANGGGGGVDGDEARDEDEMFSEDDEEQDYKITSYSGKKSRKSGASRKRGGGSRKSSAGLRVGAEVWCNSSSDDEAQGRANSAQHQRGGKTKRARRKCSTGQQDDTPRPRKNKKRASLQTAEHDQGESHEDDEGAPPAKKSRKNGVHETGGSASKRGRRKSSARGASRSACVVPTDGSVCAYCFMSLRSERARKAHRCLQQKSALEGMSADFHDPDEDVEECDNDAASCASSVTCRGRGYRGGVKSWKSPAISAERGDNVKQKRRGRPPKKSYTCQVQEDVEEPHQDSVNVGEQDQVPGHSHDDDEESDSQRDNSTASLEEALRAMNEPATVTTDCDADVTVTRDNTSSSAQYGDCEANSGRPITPPPCGDDSQRVDGTVEARDGGNSQDSANKTVHNSGADIQPGPTCGENDVVGDVPDVDDDQEASVSESCRHDPVSQELSDVKIERQSTPHPSDILNKNELEDIKNVPKQETSQYSTDIKSTAEDEIKPSICSQQNKTAKDDIKPMIGEMKPDDKTAESATEDAKPCIVGEQKNIDDLKQKQESELNNTESQHDDDLVSRDSGHSKVKCERSRECWADSSDGSDQSDSDEEDGEGAGRKMLLLPDEVSEPSHVPDIDRDQFQLVADTFSSLRRLISTFIPTNDSEPCEIQLHKSLSDLLLQLEPLETKITQSVCNMRKRLCHEWLSFVDRPADFKDPSQDAWRERDAEPETTQKKRTKTPSPEPAAEDSALLEDELWCDGRRRTRSRRAKCKPVNYCVDSGGDRRTARQQTGAWPCDAGDTAVWQTSSRGRVRRVRKMDDFAYDVTDRMMQQGISEEDEDHSDTQGVNGAASSRRTDVDEDFQPSSIAAGDAARADRSSAGTGRLFRAGSSRAVEPSIVWNSELTSSLGAQIDERVSNIRDKLLAKLPPSHSVNRTSTTRLSTGAGASSPVSASSAVRLASPGTRRIVMKQTPMPGTSNVKNTPLSADKYVLKVGADGRMYMEKLAATSSLASTGAASCAVAGVSVLSSAAQSGLTQSLGVIRSAGTSPAPAAAVTNSTAGRVAVMMPCLDKTSGNTMLMRLPSHQADAVLQSLSAGTSAVSSVSPHVTPLATPTSTCQLFPQSQVVRFPLANTPVLRAISPGSPLALQQNVPSITNTTTVSSNNSLAERVRSVQLQLQQRGQQLSREQAQRLAVKLVSKQTPKSTSTHRSIAPAVPCSSTPLIASTSTSCSLARARAAAPPPMQRAPRLVSSSVRFMNTGSGSAATVLTSGVVVNKQQQQQQCATVPTSSAAVRPITGAQQGKVVVIKSGSEQKLGVLLGNGQIVELSASQANMIKQQATRRLPASVTNTITNTSATNSASSLNNTTNTAVVATTPLSPSVSNQQ